MKLNKLPFFLLFHTVFCFSAFAQTEIPVGYFQFPIKPGVQNFLSGSMGELRPGHFHGGIDIKTDGRVGLPVYAAADGYVSRYKQSSYGYGNVIYLTHPNELVTVYGHLDSFAPALADFMLKNQYEKQTFELELTPERGKFSFKKGDIIGYSGNTGGSGGPHLHFEIRTKDDVQMNVLRCKFPEIVDTTPPVFKSIALRTFSIDARVKDQFGRFEFFPVKTGAEYTLKDTIYAHGLLGLELQAFDQLDKAENKNGLQQVELAVNGQFQYAHHIDNIPLEKSKQISCHTNYEVLKLAGKTFEKCYIADGNTLPFYQTAPRRGKFLIQPGSTNKVSLIIKDAAGNKSVLNFIIIGRKPVFGGVAPVKPQKPQIDYALSENILKITANDTAKQIRNVELFVSRTKYQLIPSYTLAAGSVYLYDIRGGIPDSLVFCGISRKIGIKQIVPSNTELNYIDSNMAVLFRANSLYDTLYMEPAFFQETYTVNDVLTPLHQPIQLTLKPQNLPPDLSKASVYSLGWGKSRGFLGGKWTDNTITAQTKVLGKFKILSDSVPPTIKLIKKSKAGISLRISDNLSGIASFRAELNGQWLLMKYEHKTATIYSEKLDKSLPLSGDFVLKVKDSVGNEATYTTKIL